MQPQASLPAATSRFTRPVRSGDGTVEVSVVLPCLNEEETVAGVIREALAGIESAGVTGEVIVVDNGSTDRSAERAEAAGEGRQGPGHQRI